MVNKAGEELGLAWGEGGGERLERRLLLPSLTIRTLASGKVGDKLRNAIPSTATAALGVRLVKGNDPEHMLAEKIDLAEWSASSGGCTTGAISEP